MRVAVAVPSSRERAADLDGLPDGEVGEGDGLPAVLADDRLGGDLERPPGDGQAGRAERLDLAAHADAVGLARARGSRPASP